VSLNGHIHRSNVGPDLGGTDAGGRRGEIGAALSWGVRAADLTTLHKLALQ
jgi:hypothetical protein